MPSGIPTADAQAISKGLRAKLKKKHARHAVLVAGGRRRRRRVAMGGESSEDFD